jgi:DNA-binding transcriptional MerR regulator
MSDRIWQVPEDDEPVYTRRVAAHLAGISIDFLYQCEQEHLIQVKVMRGGGPGLNRQDIRRLARIRRLQQDLELNMPAVEVVLHLRERVIDLARQLDEMEWMMEKREEELMAEIRRLQRHMAEEIHWEIR